MVINIRQFTTYQDSNKKVATCRPQGRSALRQWSVNSHHVVQKLSLGCLKVEPKLSPSRLEAVQKLSQKCLKVANVVSKAETCLTVAWGGEACGEGGYAGLPGGLL